MLTSFPFRFAALGAAAVLVSATSMTGCHVVTVSSFCEQTCECMHCNADKLHECNGEVGAAQEEAKRRGCGDLFDDLLDCADSNMVCKNGDADDDCETSAYDACMKANNPNKPCIDAEEHIIECDGIGEAPADSTCKGDVLCTAACISSASCEAIRRVFGESPVDDPSDPLLTCMSDCQTR